MALDFSEYGGPSEEWLAIEKTLPALTFDINAEPVALRSAVNTERENRTAAAFAQLSAHVQTKDYSIPTRDGSSIEARTYRSVKKAESEKLPVFMYFHGKKSADDDVSSIDGSV
jgi:acetyl esterase/lipase